MANDLTNGAPPAPPADPGAPSPAARAGRAVRLGELPRPAYVPGAGRGEGHGCVVTTAKPGNGWIGGQTCDVVILLIERGKRKGREHYDEALIRREQVIVLQ